MRRSLDEFELQEAFYPWDSVVVETSGIVPYPGWFSFTQSGVLFLKDTQKGVYSNQLLEGGHLFSYELPMFPSSKDTQRMKATVLEAVQSQRALIVRLFCVSNARNHYLGEFVPVRVETGHRCCVILHRLKNQDIKLLQAYALKPTRKRSRSESLHFDALQSTFENWSVTYEPEAAVNLTSNLVKDGRMSTWASDTYTVDFICSLGPFRICVESKFSQEDMDEKSKMKCLQLRDNSYTRVIGLAGHGEDQLWYDFGSPGSDDPVLTYKTGKDLLFSLKKYCEVAF